jgi:hypothetical protein
MKKFSPGLAVFVCTTVLAVAAAQDETEQSARVRLSGELTREFRLNPGDHAEGRLILQNSSATESCSARIYQTDYHFSADGSTTYDAPGTTQRSNAAWIEIDDHQPELKPGETRAVPFNVTVPPDAALHGTYWSMIMVEPLAIEPKPTAGTMVIRSVMRYGVQIVVQAGATAEARPLFTRQMIALQNGRRVLSFDLANEGERWLSPKLEVRLFDGQGHAIAVLPAKTSHVFPGTSVRHVFDIATLARGDYLALIVLDNGEELYGAQYRFRIED